MSTFPDVIGVSYNRTPQYSTTVSQLGTNNRVRYRKWLRPRFTYELKWDSLALSDAQQIHDFIISVEGAAQPFYWFDWRSFRWNNVQIGTGDGSTTTFDIPGKNTVDQLFYINGTTQVAADVLPGAGADGVDRVVLTAPPDAGVPITATFVGRLRSLVTFATDEDVELPRVLETGCYQFSTTLTQTK